MLEINNGLIIPDGELTFTFARSSGPGGQNVNKVNTKVTLSFDIARSDHLSAEQKHLLETRLAHRLTREGLLQVSVQDSRSQWSNRQLALDRMSELIREALKNRPPRKKTRVPPEAKRRRIEAKRRTGLIKKQRQRPGGEPD